MSVCRHGWVQREDLPSCPVCVEPEAVSALSGPLASSSPAVALPPDGSSPRDGFPATSDASGGAVPAPQLSPDGHWWWDGQTWLPTAPTAGSAPVPSGAHSTVTTAIAPLLPARPASRPTAVLKAVAARWKSLRRPTQVLAVGGGVAVFCGLAWLSQSNDDSVDVGKFATLWEQSACGGDVDPAESQIARECDSLSFAPAVLADRRLAAAVEQACPGLPSLMVPARVRNPLDGSAYYTFIYDAGSDSSWAFLGLANGARVRQYEAPTRRSPFLRIWCSTGAESTDLTFAAFTGLPALGKQALSPAQDPVVDPGPAFSVPDRVRETTLPTPPRSTGPPVIDSVPGCRTELNRLWRDVVAGRLDLAEVDDGTFEGQGTLNSEVAALELGYLDSHFHGNLQAGLAHIHTWCIDKPDEF